MVTSSPEIDAAPMCLQQNVVDGRAAGLPPVRGSGSLVSGSSMNGMTHGCDVVAALAAAPVEGALFGEAVALLDAVDAEEVLDDVHVVVGQHDALVAAAGEDGGVLGEDILMPRSRPALATSYIRL